MPKMKKADREQCSFPADRDVHRQLKQYAEAADISMSRLMRQAQKMRLSVILREQEMKQKQG